MQVVDWLVLVATLCVIIIYGLYKSRSTKDLDGYFRSNRSMHGGLILLSIMGTQASAITFLSAPGQAYTDGMRFVQYYFGLPIAMVVVAYFFVPVYHRLQVYTAYEYLEKRFDGKTRALTSFLFLLQRGLSTGISVFAPSIILSSILGWSLTATSMLMGGLLIIYTLSGGARAVAYTQQLQWIIIFLGLGLAGWMVVNMLPTGFGFSDALRIGQEMGKLNVVSSGFSNGKFDWSDQYNIWSGLIGGFFLALSYFGTDQSQVGRYLTAKNSKESRIGLLLNGLVKVPMQFLILLVGVLVFSFYQFNKAPVFFNQVQLEQLRSNSHYKDSLTTLENSFVDIAQQKKQLLSKYATIKKQDGNAVEQKKMLGALHLLNNQHDSLRKKVKEWIRLTGPVGANNDTNYIFLRFVIDYLPTGLVGLLIAIIFLASWGSIAAAVNSLAACTMIDFHQRFTIRKLSEQAAFNWSRWYTLLWGLFCIVVALFTYNIGNSLIEAVNVLGSLFYGVVLGIFLVALFIPLIKNGTVVFTAAILAEIMVIFVFYLSKVGYFKLAFLWLNPVGVAFVVLFSFAGHLLVTFRRA